MDKKKQEFQAGLKITPTEAKNTVSVTVGGGSAGGQAKTYYASLSVTNQSPDDIEIKYTVMDKSRNKSSPRVQQVVLM